jgi:hypothetical protein
MPMPQANPTPATPSQGAPSLPDNYGTDWQAKEAARTAKANVPYQPLYRSLYERTGNIHNGLERALARIGSIGLGVLDTAGTIAAPGIMSAIPGTAVNEGLRAKHASQEKSAESRRELEAAESHKALNPPSEFGPFPGAAGPQGEAVALDKSTGKAVVEPQTSFKDTGPSPWRELTGAQGPNGEPVMYNEQTGKTVLAPGMKMKPPNPSAEQDAQRYESIQQQINQKLPVPPDEMAWAKGYEKMKGLGSVPPAVIHTQEQARQGEANRVEHSSDVHEAILDKLEAPIRQKLDRFATNKATIDAGSPQADAFIAPELLSVMAGGQGSGLRMNEAEINRAVNGRSHWESLEAAINKWSLDPGKALSVTPEQRLEMRNLSRIIQSRYALQAKILDDSRSHLVTAETPQEHRQIIADTHKKLNAVNEGKVATPELINAAMKKAGITADQAKQSFVAQGWVVP